MSGYPPLTHTFKNICISINWFILLITVHAIIRKSIFASQLGLRKETEERIENPWIAKTKNVGISIAVQVY